jgi:hypothetical protein
MTARAPIVWMVTVSRAIKAAADDDLNDFVLQDQLRMRGVSGSGSQKKRK